MRCVSASLLALAACGRIEFAERTTDANVGDAPDVLTGHDEDGDGIADSLDPCPFVAGSTTDGDGDGVGDDCDPNPTTKGDAITVFSPLTPGTAPFDNITGWTEGPDGISIATSSSLYLPRALGNTHVEIGFVIHALVGTGQHQLAVGIEGTSPYYFVELNENGGQKNVSVVSYDAVNGYSDLGMVTYPGMHPGTGLLHLDATASPVPNRQFHIRAGWTGELYDAMGPTTQYSGGNALRWAINGLDVTITYVAIIDSP